jgi:ABC-type anion transport system duplicated permease subunit
MLTTSGRRRSSDRCDRAEKVLVVPLLDILQSVPVPRFLTITVTAFINPFPGSELGLDPAKVGV